MPGPYIPDPTPDWLKPENASVTDSALTKAMRRIAHVIGADNPSAQVVELMTTDVPGGPNGGVAGALGRLVEKANTFIKAYHGSPHDFERFSMEKIGTGEGAQAYGHGLYFAENPRVAQDYRDTLSTAVLKHKNEPFEVAPINGRDWLKMSDDQQIDYSAREMVADAWKQRGFNLSPAEVVQRADENARLAFRAPEHADYLKSIRARIQDIGKDLTTHEGKMYEVAIKADPESFLDWDKPLSQQNERVKYAMGYQPPPTPDEVNAMWTLAKQRKVPPASMPEYKALEARADAAAKFDRDYPNGRAIYNELMNDQRDVAIRQGRVANTTLPKSQEIATQQLRDFGIPGIKYLDQGSRAAGEGSRNYVVFDDKLVDILNKYGVAGAAIEGLRRKAQAQGGSITQDDIVSVQ